MRVQYILLHYASVIAPSICYTVTVLMVDVDLLIEFEFVNFP